LTLFKTNLYSLPHTWTILLYTQMTWHQESNGGVLGRPGGCQGARGVQESKGGGLSGQEARLGGHGVKEWQRVGSQELEEKNTRLILVT